VIKEDTFYRLVVPIHPYFFCPLLSLFFLLKDPFSLADLYRNSGGPKLSGDSLDRVTKLGVVQINILQ